MRTGGNVRLTSRPIGLRRGLPRRPPANVLPFSSRGTREFLRVPFSACEVELAVDRRDRDPGLLRASSRFRDRLMAASPINRTMAKRIIASLGRLQVAHALQV